MGKKGLAREQISEQLNEIQSIDLKITHKYDIN